MVFYLVRKIENKQINIYINYRFPRTGSNKKQDESRTPFCDSK